MHYRLQPPNCLPAAILVAGICLFCFAMPLHAAQDIKAAAGNQWLLVVFLGVLIIAFMLLRILRAPSIRARLGLAGQVPSTAGAVIKIVAAAACGLLWIVDSLLEKLFFSSNEPFLSILLPLSDLHELYMRLFYVGSIITGGAVVSVYLDRLVHSRETAAAQAEHLRCTLDSIGDAVITVSADGLISAMNPVARRLTGWSVDEAVGKPLTEVFHIVNARTRETVDNPVTRVLEEDGIVGLANHTMLIAKNGDEYQIADSAAPIKDRQGRITGVVLVFRDVTKAYALQEELRAREERFKALFEHMSSGVAVYEAVDNGEDFVVTEFNPAAERITGISRQEAVGNRLMTLFLHMDQSGLLEALQRVRRTGQSEDLPPFYYKDSVRQGWRENLIYKLPSGEVVALFDDVTERKQAEEKARHLNLALRAIRDINQIIVREKDRDRLLQSVCDNLIETHAYYNAWIVLWDEAGGLVTTAEAGLDGDFTPLMKNLKHGRLPDCCRRALTQAGVVVTGDPLADCSDCPLAPIYGGRSGLAARLDHAGRVLGILCASVPRHVATDGQEQSLFEEMATDIGFALHALEALEALRQEKEKFKSLFNGMRQPVFIHPLLSEGFANFIEVNDTACERYGYSREEFFTISPKEITATEDVKRLGLSAARRRLLEEGLAVFEATHITKDGRSFPVEINSNIFSWAGRSFILSIAMDITERKKAEEERVGFLSAITQTSEGIVITDLEGTIQYVNPAFEQITGYSREEAICRNPSILKSGEHSAEFYQEMWDTLTSGKTWSGRFINRKKDGSQYIEDAIISPVRDASGKTTNYVAAKRDVTEHVRLAKEKIEMLEQLQQARKVESIGRLAGGVAHDMNNLLSPILGYGELLRQDTALEDDRRKMVDAILSAGFRARDLVRQLLAFSRKQTLDFKPVDINNVVTGFEKLLRKTIPEDITMELFLSPDPLTVMADIGQIEQILMNLAVNGADAMAGGGRLTIETAPAELDEKYAAEHAAVEPGPYVLLAVSDTGCGMDEETRENIFEPFFSTKGEAGTGLGLATVYGIVKQHGGNIWVYSEPGKGATFKIYLPAYATAPVEETRGKKETVEPHGTETILIAEDNGALRDLARTILENLKYTVLTAENGKEALAIVERHHGPLHLLLTDVVMPEMNGRELFERAVAHHPDLKALYMSGYTDNVIAHRGVLDDGVAFIQKPFTINALAAKVREVLEH